MLEARLEKDGGGPVWHYAFATLDGLPAQGLVEGQAGLGTQHQEDRIRPEQHPLPVEPVEARIPPDSEPP